MSFLSGEDVYGVLDTHKRNWEELAELDPLWAILSNTSHQHGAWDINAFLGSGEREIARVMDRLSQQGYHVAAGSVLDFGCGVGRLTRALASRFTSCYGVDISERMIENARQLNLDCVNCQFLVNTVDNLRIFPDDSFDMIYTNLVLQHIPQRETIKSYIKDFVRILKPDGVAVFQLPSHISLRRQVQPRRRAYTMLRALGFPHTLLYKRLGLNPMKMTFIPEREVKVTISSVGGHVDLVDTQQVPGYQSSIYFVTKQHPAS